MKQEALSFFTDTWLTLIGLTIFFTYFVYMIIHVLYVKKEYYDAMEKLPLRGDSK
ncbi:MAG: cbb3-type cytochrome c oxidase subunit 3 [Bdellovibrionales bacterium]|nr:cbb3-type cytochrome c oxidase subunit 3 [Bdellovibrionales bacterium]